MAQDSKSATGDGKLLEALPERRNYFWLAVAYLSIGLGVVGAFLPLLPTTPFLLLAAWSAAKGSPSLHRWLYEHPQFGGALIAWEQERAVSTRAKWVACVFMAVSWLIMLWQTDGWLVPAITGTIFVCVSTFLITRPAPPRDPSALAGTGEQEKVARG